MRGVRAVSEQLCVAVTPSTARPLANCAAMAAPTAALGHAVAVTFTLDTATTFTSVT